MKIFLFTRYAKALTLRSRMSDRGRHFAVLRPAADPQDYRKEVLKKFTFDLKNHGDVSFGKRFSSGGARKNFLMDFEVQFTVGNLKLLRNLYYLALRMKNVDPEFDVLDFSKCSLIALEVVTTLLSQLRFSELEGLLTERCKEEIESNIKTLPMDQLSALAVTPKNIIYDFPVDIVMSAENENKTLVEIIWGHYVWVKNSSGFHENEASNQLMPYFFSHMINTHPNWRDEEGTHFKTQHIAAVFNSKFIKEFSNDTNNQWIINAINYDYFTNIKAYL